MEITISNAVFCWFIAGIILILSEFIVPGFIICFFGVASLIMAGVMYFYPGIPLVFQLLSFVITGVLLLIACRRFMPRAFRGTKDDHERDIDSDDVADSDCVCIAKITPGTPGKVDFRGSTWNATAQHEIAEGEQCIVLKRNNLTLTVIKKEV